MADCTHDCSSCGESCAERTDPQSFLERPHEGTRVKKVIGVVSGKGGVGKSLITSLLAVAAAREGKSVGILDADITGPSIPKIFGVTGHASGDEYALYPATSESGVSVMSINLLLENMNDPVIWRGPVIAGAVKQFWTDVAWGELDYLFVDMPPGTGDVPLTVFQSLPVDGIIIVTSPQELVSMIVQKAVKMAEAMHIPVLGIVENMSYITCPDCGKPIYLFGKGRTEEVAASFGIPKSASLPVMPELAHLCDMGCIDMAPKAVTADLAKILPE